MMLNTNSTTGGEARAEAQHQQHREEQLGDGAQLGRHLGRQERHRVFVFEQSQGGVPALRSWSGRT